MGHAASTVSLEPRRACAGPAAAPSAGRITRATGSVPAVPAVPAEPIPESEPRPDPPARQSVPLDIHRPIELLLGAVLAIIPLLGSTTGLIAMPAYGVIVSMAAGLALLTFGLAGRREQEGVSVAAHRLGDRLVVIGLLITSALALLSGDIATGVFLGLIGIGHGVLSLTTRYTRTVTGGNSRGGEPS